MSSVLRIFLIIPLGAMIILIGYVSWKAINPVYGVVHGDPALGAIHAANAPSHLLTMVALAFPFLLLGLLAWHFLVPVRQDPYQGRL